MSDKKKFPHADAMVVAGEFAGLLSPYCERVQICGSIRRRKKEVSDIELLFVPRIGTEPDGLFETKEADMASAYVESLFKSGLIGKRLNSAGYIAGWGPKNKLGIHTPSGIPVDFFTTTAAAWWVSLVIRTGSKETNLKLTTGAQKLGRSLEAYGSGVKCFGAVGGIMSAVETGYIHARSEQEVFELCGVPYLEPDKR